MAQAKSKKKKKKVRPTGKLKEFHNSQRGRKLRGTCYILLAVFLLVSVISYFRTWPDHKSNWMGDLGNWVAGYIVQDTFGIGALGFCLIFVVFGLHLWKVNVWPWRKTLWCTVFWMLWLSSVLGYCFGVWPPESIKVKELAGGVGVFVSEQLTHLINWGTMVLLVFLAVVMLIFVHKVHLRMPKVTMPEMPKMDLKSTLRNLVPAREEKEDDEEEEKEEKPVATPVAADPFQSVDPINNEVTFTIDDEFARVNAKAQQLAAKEQEPPQEQEAELAPEEDALPCNDEIDFTIAETSVLDSQQPVEVPHYAEFETTHTTDHYTVDELYDPHLDLKMYLMPQTDILTDWETKNVKVTKEELVANKDHIVETLRNYGIEITGITASPGPTVTLYEIKPAPGVRISKIKSLEDDIALSLSALGIRIIAPIPGKGTVGIEVPNANPQIVSMKNMLECEAFQHADKMELPIVFGKTISNEPFVTDLAKMPHLLMAGATGTGKSVGLNAVIASLLYKKHPSELKFVMVDPKKVELSLYNKIERHYLAKLPDSDEPIITDTKKVVRTLNSLCIEMDQRYDLLKQAGVRKITEYNEKFVRRQLNPENGHRYLPYIVLVVDEFADLIMTAGKEVEMPICRLAQLARAVGIHLIIATQRPTTNIITGTIKANFPARVAFKVTSGIDSRTILDCSGAQRLIGRGDMLISLSGSDLVRIQCALIETKEIEELADFIGSQRGYPDGFLLPEYLDENEEPNKDFDPKQKDEFFNDAAHLVVASQFGSTSLLQRKLQLGYNRAGRIIDQLEAAGIVGPYNGSKAREVLVHDEVQLEEILRNL